MELRKKVTAIMQDNITQTAMWIGFSYGVMAVIGYLLEVPELKDYAGMLNFIAYALKSINDKRKK